jgi:predicted phosphodiesterase
MIYLLADQHGGERVGELQKYIDTANDGDLLIILGDIGLKFRDTEENRAFDELILSSSKKIAFLDGNHENFKYIYSFPEEDWCGGRVHRLSENVIHLERGYIYEIDGKSFFTFGGCISSERWRELGLWQPEEAPTEAELRRAYANLDACGRKVDYVLMHKYENGRGTRTPELLLLSSFIDSEVEFKHLYAGHWHQTFSIDEKHSFVYDELIPLEKTAEGLGKV